MIFSQSGFVSGDSPAGVPLIGYDNKITDAAASSSAAGFPASNLLNSATHLVWKGSAAGQQTIGLQTDGSTNYLGIAAHNLFDIGSRVSLAQTTNLDVAAGYLTMLMHFEGTNGGTDYFDTSGNDVAFGNFLTGTLDVTQFAFGTMSLRINGAGYAWTGGQYFTFPAGTDFTIDMWVRFNALGTQMQVFDSGQESTGFGIRKTAANVMQFRAGAINRITGAGAVSAGVFMNIVLTRQGSSTKLWVNGVQQGSTYIDTTSYVPSSSEGRFGQTLAAGDSFNGWIDELRVLTGKADTTFPSLFTNVANPDGLITPGFGKYPLLFHFDGVDASTTIVDDSGSGHVFTAQGNAQLDNAQKQFGTTSLLLDGTGDFLRGDGSEDFAFGTHDFTIDFWIRPVSLAGNPFLYDGRASGSNAPSYPVIFIDTASSKLVFFAGGNLITGITNVPTGAWSHVALARASGTTRLFLNGIQEGSVADPNNYLATPTRPLLGGGDTGQFFNGWIDEFRILKGTALFTSKFVVPKRAAGSQATLGRAFSLSDGLPIIFRFTPTTNYFSLRMSGGSSAAQIAVIYAGTLLVLERGVKADTGHFDIVHARRSDVLMGMSTNGNFLGRVLLSEWRESQAEFAWFTPDWYRTNFEPFVQSAITDPFFFAWNPDAYPAETAFAWISEDVRPETDPATRRMAATISMQAIA